MKILPGVSRGQQRPAGWVPVVTGPDWMTEEDLRASLDAVTDEDEPCWLQEGDPDPQDDDPPGEYDLREIGAQCREISEDQARAAANAARLGLTGALAAVAALNGRRGPGQPGSAQVFPASTRPGRAVRVRDAVRRDAGAPGAGRVRRRRRPGRVILSTAPLMMRSSGCCARGTGWRRTWRRVSTRRWRS